MGLYCESHGSKGPAVVLLHGWALHGGLWSPLVQALQTECRLTQVDLPGHGRSAPISKDAGLLLLAQLVRDRLPEPGVWVGWSLGGLVALQAALAFPESVKKLVLIGASPRFTQGTDWQQAMPLATLEQFAQQLEQDYHKTLLRFLSLQLGSGEGARASLRQLRGEIFQYQAPSASMLYAGLDLLRDSDLRTRLPEITIPVLLIHGTKDMLVPLGAAQHMAQMLPQAHLHIIDNAGHAPFLSHTEECVQVLRDFCMSE